MVVAFKADVPSAHALIDNVEPVLRKLDDDLDFAAAYRDWSERRGVFNAKLAANEPEVVAEGWQRTYLRGESPVGEGASFHLTKRRLKAPKPE